MRHLLQIDRLQNDAALFALTLGPATRTSVALCGGSPRGFADISLLYSVWRGLHLSVSVIAPFEVLRFLPSEVPRAVSLNDTSDRHVQSAWQLIDNAGLVVVGPNMQLSSREQVFYARLLPTITVPVVLTTEALSLWNIDSEVRNNPRVTWLANIDSIEKLRLSGRQKLNRSRGIFGVAEFLQTLPVAADFIMVYDAVNLYSYIPATDTLIHSPLHGPARLVRNLVLSLLPITVFARSGSVELEESLKVLHYIFCLVGGRYIGDSGVWSNKIKHILA